MSDLLYCYGCEARYNPDTKWIRGRYQGTSSNFSYYRDVPEGCCPLCERKNEDNIPWKDYKPPENHRPM